MAGEGRKPGVRRDLRAEVTERILQSIESGTPPWQKPWDEVAGGAFQARNPVSGNKYRGVNQLLLSADARNDSDPRWMTYRQAQSKGWQVKKGSRGVEVVKVVTVTKKESEDDEPENGKLKSLKNDKQFKFLKSYTVFHASQIEGIPPLENVAARPEPERIARAESILEKSGVPIAHDSARGAYYSPTRDEIHLPPRAAFQSAEGYYATALHELGHATGHSSRLNRETLVAGGGFGSPSYAKEELRAELASAMVGAEIGLKQDQSHIDQHAAYLKSWAAALREDKHELFRAIKDAEKASEFILGLEKEREHEHDRPAPAQAREAAAGGEVADKPNLERGRYSGKVLAADEQSVQQNVGRGQTITHRSGDLDRQPAAGERVTVQYKNGRGTVESRERGRGKELVR